MKPSNELIEKFRQIYFEEFGEKITRQQAYDKFLRLTNLLRVVIRPRSSVKPRDTPLGFSVPGFNQDAGNGNIKES